MEKEAEAASVRADSQGERESNVGWSASLPAHGSRSTPGHAARLDTLCAAWAVEKRWLVGSRGGCWLEGCWLATVEGWFPRDARAVADADDDGEHQGDDRVIGDDGPDEDRHEIDCKEEGELAVGRDHRDDLRGDHAGELRLAVRGGIRPCDPQQTAALIGTGRLG